MLAVHSQKNANYLHILGVLRYLRDEKLISEAQYLRAKTYYRKTQFNEFRELFSESYQLNFRFALDMCKDMWYCCACKSGWYYSHPQKGVETWQQ